MFQKILQWIREVVLKMLGQQANVKQALSVDIAISTEMSEALETWARMYLNQATWLTTDVKSLNLPAAIAAEIARAVTIEMGVEVSGSARADYLNAELTRNLLKIRQYLEYGGAKGGLVMKPYISGANIAVDFVQADMFYPVAFDSSGNMTGCIFADRKTINGKYFTRLEYHHYKDGLYTVRNLAYKSDSSESLGFAVPLETVPGWEDLQPETMLQGVTRPLYAYYRPPLGNNIDPTSPLGVSWYARAVAQIEAADRQWSSLLWEFESGNRALYVDLLAFDKDQSGKPVLPNKRLYRAINSSGNLDDQDMFKEWTPTLREQNILNGLDAILRQIEFECGLAYGTLSNPQSVDKTATEIKIAKQRTYATITDNQKALQHALDDLLYAMDVWATLGNLAPSGTFQAVYDWDDSILTDAELDFNQDSRALNLGVMGKVEFRMRNYGETEAIARAAVQAAQDEKAADLAASVVIPQ